MKVLLVNIVLMVMLLSCGGGRDTQSTGTSVTNWADSVLAALTLEEKIGQLIMPRGYSHYFSSESEQYRELEHFVRDVQVGGIVLFQGDVYEQAVLLNKLQAVSKLPLLIAADYERGVAMRTRRGTYFPDAMAVGATRSAKHAYDVGRAIAEEARAIGVHQNYAPVADVNNNPENPVINTRAFSDDAALVSEMGMAITRGMQENGLIATAKHFPGHGDTEIDSHISLPVLPFSRHRLDSLELSPFKELVEAGVKSVMVGHLAVPSVDETGYPATLSRSITTSILRDGLGFNGLIVTDAMEMMGVAKGFSNAEATVKAFLAGADLLLLPEHEAGAVNALIAAVRRGEIPMERVDRSVRRVLEAKQWLGLHQNRFVDIHAIGETVANRKHLQLARAVARDAITVVRNDGGILPLKPGAGAKVLALALHDRNESWSEVHRSANPWPVEFAGEYFYRQLRERIPTFQTARLTPASGSADVDAALKQLDGADVVIVPLFVKVRTHSGRIGIPQNLQAVAEKLNALKKPVVVIAFGNPYNVASFPNAQGLICAYTDAEPLVEAAVQAMFGEIPWRGKLPISIRGLYPFGAGVQQPQVALRTDDPEVAGFVPSRLLQIDSIITVAIRDSAFPAAQVLVAKDGVIAYQKAFGTYTYEKSSRDISTNTLFDLASLTKVIVTTSCVMKLHDEKKLPLDTPVGDFFAEFNTGAKATVTVRHLLTHTSGLPPFRQLWKFVPDSLYAIDTVLSTSLVATPGDSTIYSDLGFIILGKIIERISGMKLDQYANKTFFEPLGMSRTMFVPTAELFRGIAPTEIDTSWRKRPVHGTVHDENAGFLGGVSGHAGLFSNARDLAVIMQMLLNGGTYGGQRFFSEGTVAEFVKKQGENSSRALGWDTKSPRNSSAGSMFAGNSFGHTGFTGTSIWADPQRKLFLILLTNRVHPTRANSKIAKVRPAVADAVINSLSE